MKLVSKLFLTMSAALSMASFTAIAMDDQPRETGIPHAAPVSVDKTTGTLTTTGPVTISYPFENPYLARCDQPALIILRSEGNTYSGSTTISKGVLEIESLPVPPTTPEGTLTLLGNESEISGRVTVKSGAVLRVSRERYDVIRDKLDVEEGGKVEIIE